MYNWDCVMYYVSLFGQWVGGNYATVGWLMAKIAENCI